MGQSTPTRGLSELLLILWASDEEGKKMEVHGLAQSSPNWNWEGDVTWYKDTTLPDTDHQRKSHSLFSSLSMLLTALGSPS